MVLHLKNITIKSQYGTILKNISLQVATGTICGIIGASGAGKSVLLHSIIQGLGSGLTVSGQVDCLNSFLVPQDINETFNPTKKISSQLPSKNITKIHYLLQELQLNFSPATLNKYPSSFSQGELQRISILLALAQNKKIILLDEPTAFLDPQNKNRLQQLLQKLQQQGYTFLIATHELDWLTPMAHAVYQLQDGKINQYILPPDNFRAELLHNFYNLKLVSNEELSNNQNGNLLNIKQGKVFSNKKPILENLNCCLSQGDVLAIIGSSGVGKTSLAKAIAKQDSYKLQGNKAEGGTIGYVSQNYSAALTPHLLVKDNLLLALQGKHKLSWYTKYKQILRLCSKLNLSSALLKKYPVALSLGEKQRFILIRSLLFYIGKSYQNPQILILDEITSSLNMKNQTAVIKLLQEFLKKYNLTYIIVTHNSAILQNLANKCLHVLAKKQHNFYTKKI